MPIFVRRDGIVIDRNRQRRRGLTPAGTPKAIAKSSEQKRSGFARDAGKSQQNGCQNAPIRGRHDDGNDGFPLASAKGHGTFAEGDRNGAEELLGAAERDGNHHQAESKSARKGDRKSTRLNSSHLVISYAVFCLKKKKKSFILVDSFPKIYSNLCR